jgi:methyl halide transferase
MPDKLDEKYWNDRYINADTGWDMGKVSPPLKAYIDQLENKNLSILIPGCGNGYEAEYLLQKGFTDISLIDISAIAVQNLKGKLAVKNINIVHGDFFKLEQNFDLIIEQTFFCALDPVMRKDYVVKMYGLLKPGGKLIGLLFNRFFEGGPPFGGSKAEYEDIFSKYFNIRTMDECYNSVAARAGHELFFIAEKKNSYNQ